MRREFRMPDAGEGLTEAEVLAWRVAPGDVVEVNQVLLEIETAKAAVELPSPYAGLVLELLAQEGDVVAVGEPIIAIDEGVLAGTSDVPAAPESGLLAATFSSASSPSASSSPSSSVPSNADDSWAGGASSPDLLTSSDSGERDAAAEAAAARTAEAFGMPSTAEPAVGLPTTGVTQGDAAAAGSVTAVGGAPAPSAASPTPSPASASHDSRASSPDLLTNAPQGDRGDRVNRRDREPASEPAAAAAPTVPGSAGAPTEPKREAVLVGYGVRAAKVPQRRRRLGPHGIARPEPGPPGEAAKPVRHGGLEQARAVERRLAESAPKAKPPVRRLARDLGIALEDVLPTGPQGTITHDDVTRAAQRRLAPAGIEPGGPAARLVAPTGPPVIVSPTAPPGVVPLGGAGSSAPPDADRVPLSHVARMMSRAMTASAFTAPHVTEWVDVDVTATTRLIAAARAHPQWAGRSVTPLTVAALGLVRAAREFPTINATLDGDDLLVHRHVHLGVAVDSPRGLVVPHIPQAESLDLAGMAEALGTLIGTARAGRSRPDQLRGSTITLTNVGVFGVDGGTPILNPGESAILALGRVLPRPWVVDGVVVVRDVVTLALSFDHRVVDGALGSRVLRRVADFLQDPGTALALGQPGSPTAPATG